MVEGAESPVWIGISFTLDRETSALSLPLIEGPPPCLYLGWGDLCPVFTFDLRLVFTMDRETSSLSLPWIEGPPPCHRRLG